ncbi:MAG: hypothetical protein JWM85_3143 [Acidimicrobiaceae bacterium]|nr:hypothetical protein [Acidimicrobiaceae bacterium]
MVRVVRQTWVTPNRWHQGTSPRTAQTALAVITAAGLALAAAACGGSPTSQVAQLGSTTRPSSASSSAGGSTNSPLLAFSHCMRSHGVPNWPDPQPGATNIKFPGAAQLKVGSSQLAAAENSCDHLLPAGSDDQFPAAEVPLLLSGMVKFSECLRSHGVTNWPDPTTDAQGRPYFPLSSHGITRSESRSQQMMTKQAECQHLMPAALGGIPVG